MRETFLELIIALEPKISIYPINLSAYEKRIFSVFAFHGFIAIKPIYKIKLTEVRKASNEKVAEVLHNIYYYDNFVSYNQNQLENQYVSLFKNPDIERLEDILTKINILRGNY